MHRICLCLSIILFAVAIGAPALARETRHSSPNSGSCAEASALAEDKSSTTAKDTPAATPERETRARPSVHGDAPGRGRLSPRRWHNFLPGMVR